MKNLSPKTIRMIIIGAVLLIAAALLIARLQACKQNTSLHGEQFETYYTKAIDSLHTHAQAVRDKLRANLPGDLEILPEQLLKPVKPAETKNPEESTGSITLRGIYWSDTLPLAEINDRLCKPGDWIEGFTLKEIQPYQVILLDPLGATNILSLVKEL